MVMLNTAYACWQGLHRGYYLHLASLKRALSLLQFALVLGCSSKKLYKLIAAGRMPSYPIGSPIRLCPAVIADWLRDQKTEPKPCPGRATATGI